jgi:hypothetical protein
MKTLTAPLILFVLFSIPGAVCCQESNEITDSLALLKTDHFDAAAEARLLAPVLNAETVAIGRVDFSRVAVEPIATWVGEIAGRLLNETVAERFQTGRDLTRRLEAFRRAGGKEMYAVAALGGEGLIPHVLIAVPMGKADEKELCRALGVAGDSVQRLGDLLVIRVTPFTPPLAQFHPADRPELAGALAAAGDAPVQAVLIPPASVRRVVEELLPQLPEVIGNGPGTVLTHGLRWAAARIDLPPQAALRLVIQSQDASAAQSLYTKWLAIVKFCRQDTAKGPLQRRTPPEFPKVAASLPLKVQNDQLVLVLDEKDHALSNLLTLLHDPLSLHTVRQMHQQSMHNLQFIGLAMWNYYSDYEHLPPPATHDRSGKQLLSWRVQLLPYLEQGGLYRQFHLDEPWDSPHNKALIEKMPAVFRSPQSKAGKGMTNYLVPVGGGAIYASMKDQPTVDDITDGTSHTLMAVEVDDAHAVVWTKPEDRLFDPRDVKQFFSACGDWGYVVARCDGSSQILDSDTDVKILKALVTRAGQD